MKESDARSEGQIFVWLGGEMRPVEPEKLADQLAPMVAHVMVSRSEAEALAEALGEIKARCDRIAAGEYGGLAAAADMSDIAGRAQGDYRVRHPKETP